jgi:hypothetical protein
MPRSADQLAALLARADFRLDTGSPMRIAPAQAL